MWPTIHINGNTITVTVDGIPDSFINGVSTEGAGSTLSYSFPLYTYTSSNGTVTRFVSNNSHNFFEASAARPLDTVFPDGTKRTYTHKIVQYCAGGYEFGQCQSTLQYGLRLSTVTNSNGYQLKFYYALNKASISESEIYSWSRLTSIKALNNKAERCDLFRLLHDHPELADIDHIEQCWRKYHYRFGRAADPLHRLPTYRCFQDQAPRIGNG